jgi:2-oxoglutarate ferredoxin oxidoreductase subunit gamma
MIDEVLIAGFGGQGIMLMGKLLAYGAIYEGLEVTFYPSYGPEMRGGTANCTVVISDDRIGSPVRNRFSFLMSMNQASLDKFVDRVKPGGVVAYNDTLVKAVSPRQDLCQIAVSANRIATEMRNPQVANMVAVGAMVKLLGRISTTSLKNGLSRVLPPYRHNLIPVNEAAIDRGAESVQAAENTYEKR